MLQVYDSPREVVQAEEIGRNVGARTLEDIFGDDGSSFMLQLREVMQGETLIMPQSGC